MEIRLATIARRGPRKGSPEQALLAGYSERIGHYCSFSMTTYAEEAGLFAATGRAPGTGRTRPLLVLLDSRGKAESTEEFARWLLRQRDQGARLLLFAVGPASGWSDAARARADRMLSLGPMTLPHELAAVVAAEQIYRAFTIIEGHPYHLGHA